VAFQFLLLAETVSQLGQHEPDPKRVLAQTAFCLLGCPQSTDTFATATDPWRLVKSPLLGGPLGLDPGEYWLAISTIGSTGDSGTGPYAVAGTSGPGVTYANFQAALDSPFYSQDGPDLAIYVEGVPEPASVVLVGSGVFGLWLCRRGRGRKPARLDA
jgi:hypothetical protein